MKQNKVAQHLTQKLQPNLFSRLIVSQLAQLSNLGAIPWHRRLANAMARTTGKRSLLLFDIISYFIQKVQSGVKNLTRPLTG
ncbi:MAG: hypothetical protein VKK42_19145 [Lyngbya sp.]|nr:hypothetical protein [Lyngbya sp.]